MSKSQPHRCYLVSSVVLIIIILLLSFNTFTSNDGKVITLSYSPEWSYWPYNRLNLGSILILFCTEMHAICSEIMANLDCLHNKTTAFTTTS